MVYDKATEVLLRMDGMTYWFKDDDRWNKPICEYGKCEKRENLEVIVKRVVIVREYGFCCSEHKESLLRSGFKLYEP